MYLNINLRKKTVILKKQYYPTHTKNKYKLYVCECNYLRNTLMSNAYAKLFFVF